MVTLIKVHEGHGGSHVASLGLVRISVDKQEIKRLMSVLRTVLTVSILALRTLLIHTTFS